MERINLRAEIRDGLGKEKSAKYRQKGFIPGVIYGHGEGNKHVYFDAKKLSTIISKLESESALFEIEIEEGKEPYLAVIKEVQRHKLTRQIIHIDFQHLHKGEKISLEVPIVTTGVAPGVKEGGLLEIVYRSLHVRCLPKDIPEHIEVSVDGLNIGDSLHVGDIKFPEGVASLDNEDLSVITVIAPKKVVETTEEEVEEVTEPEVIKEKKEEEE